MQFFKHMSRMRHDPKIRRLIKKFGVEGYGIYCLIIESITDSITTEDPFPILEESVEDLADDYNIDIRIVENIVKFCIKQGLFEIVPKYNIIYCLKVYKFLNTSQTRSDSLRQMIKSVSGCENGEITYHDLKTAIEGTISLRYKDLDNRLELSETVCDNNDRREEEEKKNKNRIIIDKEAKTDFLFSKSEKPLKGIFDDEPIEVEKDEENKKKVKHKYGEYKHVLLTDEDIDKLMEKFSDWKERIKILDEGIELKGYKYKNHYMAIIKWAEKDSIFNNNLTKSESMEMTDWQIEMKNNAELL